MAVLVDNAASNGAIGSGSSLTISSFTVGNNPNRYLVVSVYIGDDPTAASVSSITWRGSQNLSVKSSTTHTWVGGFAKTETWHLTAPDAGTGDIVITWDSTVTYARQATVLSVYNVDQTTPSGAPSLVQPATVAGNTVWAGIAGVADGLAYAFMLPFPFANHTAAPVNSIAKYISVGTSAQSNGATSISPTSAPAGRILGDWEYCSVANENNNTISVSGTGWGQVGTTRIADSTWQQALFRRRYDGTNVNPSFSWSGSVGCSAQRWCMRDAGNSIGFHGVNSGSGSTHSISGQNSTANNSLAMYLSHAEANTALGADADYTERFDNGSSTGPFRLVVGDREQPTSGAGAAAFSATGANASWVMRLVELLAGPTQTERAERENQESAYSVCLYTEPCDTYNQFGVTTSATPGTDSLTLLFVINPAASSGQELLPSLFTNTNSFHAPTVGRGAVGLAPSLYSDGDTFHAPAVASIYALLAALFSDGDGFHAPAVTVGSVTLQPNIFVDADTFHTPTVGRGAVSLAPGLYVDVDTFHAPAAAASNTLAPSLFSDGDTFFAPAVTAGEVVLEPDLYLDADTFHAPAVTRGAVTLAPDLFADGDTFFAAVVSAGGAALQPALFADGDVFYAATVGPGAVALSPGLFADGDQFFAATVSAGAVGLEPGLYVDPDQFLAPSVAAGAVELLPAHFTDQDVFYGATVTAEGAPAGADWFIIHRRRRR